MARAPRTPAPSTVSLLTENELAEEFVRAFAQRHLSEKFFYWFPLSVRAWLALCSDGDYRNYVRSRSLIAAHADDLAKTITGGRLEVVSLGSGQGDKDALLLATLRSAGISCSYHPVDTSQALLEMACAEASELGVETVAVKADFTRRDHLERLRPKSNAPRRLVMMLGNTLGSVDPMGYTRTMAAWLREEDLLLVDGELFSGDETMSGYDNPVNRRFAWAPLNAVGIGEDNGRIVFETSDDARRDGLHVLTKHFEATGAVHAAMAGESFVLAPDEQIAMSHSYKYTRAALLGLLEKAGFQARWDGTSDDGRFLMVLGARQA